MPKSVLFAVVAVAVTMACKQGPASATGGSAGGGSTGAAAGAPAVPPPAPPTPKPSAPSGKPPRETLAGAAAGKPVFFALDAKGQLIARTVDGSYSAVLLPGPYGDALQDVALDLVWLRRDTGLDVLDLRAPGPASATKVVTAPDKVLEKLGEQFSEPPHWTMTDSLVVMLATPCHSSTGVLFDWAKGGVGTTTGSESAKVVAKDWLAAEEHRAKREVPPAFTKAIAKRHKIPKNIGTCRADVEEDLGRGACGTGLDFGSTGLELVVVSANSNRCPAKQCQLYDKATKQYAKVPGLDPELEEAATCGPFQFDGSGIVYLVADMVCTGKTCTSVGKQAIGWLDGARVLDAN